MRLPERLARHLARRFAAALFGSTTLIAAAVAADEPLLRHRAAIVVDQPAAFVRLPLPVAAYARSEQPGLADLRIVDARGERVPFALLAPRADEAQSREQLAAVAMYPLPPRPKNNETWQTPLELTVQADRIQVRPRRGTTANPAAAAQPPGVLVDLGDPRDRPRDQPAPQALLLQWSGPAEFSVGVAVETSADLRSWQPGGGAQLLALASPAGALTQPRVPLPTSPGRFVRLVFSDPAEAPRLTGASAVTLTQHNVMLEAPTELVFAGQNPPASDEANRQALDFDLGAPLPVLQLDLDFGASGTRIAPVRLFGRLRATDPWQPLGGAVFYRLERGGAVSGSPALPLRQTLRYLRVLPDNRAGALDAAQTKARVQVQLSSVVFAMQGQAPYALLTGSAKAGTGALPLTTLLPLPEEERKRFGRASLGEWAEQADALRQAESEQRRAALRPWLLWGVLVGGVLLLGGLVWQLSRSKSPAAG